MSKSAARVDEAETSPKVELLSEAERARLTAKTTERYATELRNLLIPYSWQKTVSRCKNLPESFFHAWEGVLIGLKRERNLRIHFCLVPVVVALGLWLKVDTVGWLALVLSMAFVIATEFLNTAIEHLVDISTEGQFHISAKYAKDTAAAAVLLASLTAATIGMIVLGPRLYSVIIK